MLCFAVLFLFNNVVVKHYDGASNMAGHLSGVAVRLQREEPRAHYVHCLAHSLNLCLQECSCKCSAVRDALGVTQELANLIRASPKRLGLFNRMKNEIAPSSPGLKALCPTRLVRLKIRGQFSFIGIATSSNGVTTY